MSHRSAGRITGALFLAAFVLYGGGSALADQPAGLGLMLLNSAAVAGIGALAFRAMRPVAAWTARTYLAARTLEAVLLAIGVAYLTSGSIAVNDAVYGIAMLLLGAGSIPFCLALAKHRWAPRWLAVWGAIGYGLLAVGAMLEFTVPGSGVALAIPGGLFEIAFGILLIRRGFPTESARVSDVDSIARAGIVD